MAPPSPPPYSFLYCPFPCEKTAKEAAMALLQQRLVVCVNILPGATSLYWWQNHIEKAQESILIAKTSAFLAKRAHNFLVNQHPASTPCVGIWPVEVLHAPTRQWLDHSLSHPL